MLVCSTMVFPGSRGGGRIRRLQQRRAIEAAIEADVDVAVAGDFESGNAGDCSHGGDHIGGDLLRGGCLSDFAS